MEHRGVLRVRMMNRVLMVERNRNSRCGRARGNALGTRAHTVILLPLHYRVKRRGMPNGGTPTVIPVAVCTCPLGYAGDNCELRVLRTAGKDGFRAKMAGPQRGWQKV